MRLNDSDREFSHPWLTEGGEMGQRMRSYDWAQTSLGPLDRWPQSLRSAVSVCLGSRFPIVIYWGPDGVTLYNDGYVPILAGKHPWALGLPCREVWKEIWPVIGPMLDSARTTGQATWSDDQLLILHRHGFPEECYFSFSFGPIRGERGEIDGIFTAVIETTDRVIGERRLRVLRELSVDGMGKSDADVCIEAANILRLYPSDVPFALFFIVDDSAGTAELLEATGIDAEALALDKTIDLHATTRPATVLREAIHTRGATVAPPDVFVRALPGQASPGHVLVLPLLVGTQPAGILVAGVSRHLALSGHYRDFFDLVASRVSAVIASGRAYHEERRRAEALAEIDRAKTDFFSNVSHEFRTPLTLMLGPLEDRLTSGSLPADVRTDLEIVHRNGVRLMRLVNTLLDFSRIEAGRVDAVYEPTDVASYTAELASVFRSAIERAGLHLVVDCSPLPEPIYVDREMWEKIVLNLLSNAFKFTFQGEIGVSVRPTDESVTLLVRDTGVGIAPEEIPHIFERFHRVRGAQSRTHEGTGIGLALVQELVKLHGGQITATSRVNDGSTFAVVIPRGFSHLPPDRIGAVRSRSSTATGVAPYVAETLSWLPQQVAGAEPADGARSETPGARILLADDNADMREYVGKLLARHWTVEAVADGRAALEAARTRVPDLILTDVMMPGLDGFELLRELRADPSTRDVPVIVLSARAGEESRVEGLEAGADDYLIKPFSARELMAHVEGHLKLKNLRDRLQASLRESHERLADELADMTRLQQVSTRLIGTDDPDSLLLEIVDAAIAMTAADMGNIQLLDADSGTLKIAASRGFDAPFLEFFNAVHDGQAACGTAMQSGERVIIEDVAASATFVGTPALGVMLAAKALAVQSTPLISRSGRLVGMFSTHYQTSRRPSDRELRLLDILARQAADAVERMQAEQRLRQRTEQFEALLNNAPVGVYLVDADFRVRQVNPVARPLFGDIPDLIDRDFDEVMHMLWPRPYADEIVGIFRRTLDTGEPYFTPEHIGQRLGSGVTEYYEWRISRIPLPDGRHGVVCYFRDIAEQKKASAAKAYLAAIVDSADDAIIAKDLDGIIQSCNAAGERLFGYAASELVGRSVRILIPPERQFEEDDILARLRRGEKIDHFETVRVTKDGRRIDVSLTVSPVRDDTGRIIGASKIARDITNIKHAEAERLRLLRESAAVTEALNNVGAIVASDLDRSKVVQAVTDTGTRLTTAAFGAFFYNVVNEKGDVSTLYTISGVPREMFSKFPMPRNTQVLEPTFKGTAVVRSADITCDPRYGHNAPYHGMPPGHLPVRSYLAVPVKGPRGDVLGGLFFGHADVGRFTEQHERLALGVAAWASVALENARLYSTVQEANRIKDDFLASLSHELRTPLNAILGYARMLRTSVLPPERQRKAIEAVERNATSLAQIVEDVLDISRIVSGKMRLNVQPVELPEVVTAAIDAIAPAAEAKGIRVERIVDPQASPISGDPERLQQVLWNLLSNAVKFTSRGGRVQVRLQRVNSHIEVTVSDTGVGIAPEFLPHVFERFRQADAGSTRGHGGLGLGLSIARQLTEMHGGTIEVASGGVGKGATFRVKIPLMVVHPLREAEARVHPRSDTGQATVASTDLNGLCVLAVDDEPDALALVSEVLEAAGARVHSARSGQDALRMLESEVPDVLIADLGMPQFDGFALIDRVRHHADARVRNLPAAALTAYARSEDRMKALRAGFQIHLVKPIDPAELATTIASLARRFG